MSGSKRRDVYGNEIILPLMDKNGSILKKGDIVIYSEYDGKNNWSRYADSLCKLVSDGELLKIEKLVRTFNKKYVLCSEGDQDNIGLDCHELNITKNGTFVNDLKKVQCNDSDYVNFMEENYPHENNEREKTETPSQILATLLKDKQYIFSSFNDRRIVHVESLLKDQGIKYSTTSQLGSDYVIALEGNRFYR